MLHPLALFHMLTMCAWWVMICRYQKCAVESYCILQLKHAEQENIIVQVCCWIRQGYFHIYTSLSPTELLVLRVSVMLLHCQVSACDVIVHCHMMSTVQGCLNIGLSMVAETFLQDSNIPCL